MNLSPDIIKLIEDKEPSPFQIEPCQIVLEENQTASYIAPIVSGRNYGDIRNGIETVRDEEQDALDNLPEGLQGTARGEEMETNVESLSDVIDSLEEIDIDGMIEKINETVE